MLQKITQEIARFRRAQQQPVNSSVSQRKNDESEAQLLMIITQKHCVFDEHPHVRLGSPEGLKTQRKSKGEEQKIFKSKDDQKNAKTL